MFVCAYQWTETETRHLALNFNFRQRLWIKEIRVYNGFKCMCTQKYQVFVSRNEVVGERERKIVCKHKIQAKQAHIYLFSVCMLRNTHTT